MKQSAFSFFICLALYTLIACGEDRSGEQPLAPTVVNVGWESAQDSVLLTGRVTASPNSSLKECGFSYGNDTLSKKVTITEPTEEFSVYTDSLGAGEYYAVAFARNGIGTSYAADTLRFTIE